MIYEDYLTTEKGYIYDSNWRKVRTGNQSPRALMLTCRTVAHEMRGLPFKFNTINFATTHCDHMSRKAKRYEAMLDDLHESEEVFVLDMLPLISQDARDMIHQRFPEFAPVLDAPADEIQPEEGDDETICKGFGEVPSSYLEFLRFTLHAILEHHGEAFVDDLYEEGASGATGLKKILGLCHEPWAIPNQVQLTNMIQILLTQREIKRWRRLRRQAHTNRHFRFSAAAAAIGFLDSLPPSTRLTIRSIKLHEDRPSVAHPASHALGLIKFCQENPLLRVKRRVNIWQTVFNMSGSGALFNSWSSLPNLDRSVITWLLSEWIIEARHLVPAGMPMGSYSMVLDGDPIPEVSSRIFNTIVHRECAWQAAIEECYSRGTLPRPSFFTKRQSPFFTFSDFPAAMREIVNRSSIVQCNFDPGELWDVEEIVERHAGWSLDDWEYEWEDSEEGTYAPDLAVFRRHVNRAEPVPEWVDRLREHYFSKFEG